MREIWDSVFADREMLGRYVLLAAGLVVFTLAAAQGTVAVITAMIPDQPPRVSANTLTGPARTYTVTRSVLDDDITTGSIPKPNGAQINPCRQ